MARRLQVEEEARARQDEDNLSRLLNQRLQHIRAAAGPTPLSAMLDEAMGPAMGLRDSGIPQEGQEDIGRILGWFRGELLGAFLEVVGAGGIQSLQEHQGDFTPADYERLLQLDQSTRQHGSNREEIKKYCPTRKIAPQEEIETCTICLEEMQVGKTVRELSCGHYFHSRCADKWLKVNKVCPICRLPITDKPAQTNSEAQPESEHIPPSIGVEQSDNA